MGNGGISIGKNSRRTVDTIAIQIKDDHENDCAKNHARVYVPAPPSVIHEVVHTSGSSSHISKLRQLVRNSTPLLDETQSSAMSPKRSGGKVIVKATLKSSNGRSKDTRKFAVPQLIFSDQGTICLLGLIELVKEKFEDRLSHSKVLLKYKDEENDFITLARQADMDDYFFGCIGRGPVPSSLGFNGSSASLNEVEPLGPVTLRLYVEGLDEPEDPVDCGNSANSRKCSSKVCSPLPTTRLPSPTFGEFDIPYVPTKACRLRRSGLNGSCQALGNSRSTMSSTSDDGTSCLSAGEFLSHHLKGQQPRRWTFGRLLGTGGCAKVYRAMYMDNGQLLAVKQVQIHNHPNVKDDLTTLDREVSAMKALNHPMIVQYLGIEIDEKEDGDFTSVNILMELVGGASIACLLNEMGPFSEEVCQNYTAQILTGLEYLHSKDIVHRDIKGANILVDRRGNIKLTDFGASKRIADLVCKAEGASNLKGTIKWMAPEVCLGGGGCKASDVWSLGCTVVEMLTGDSPFPGVDQFSLLFNIGMGKCVPLIPQTVSQDAQDFLRQCFQHNPDDRPTVASLRQHPWLSGIHLMSSSEGTESDKLTSEISSMYSGPPSSRAPVDGPGEQDQLDFSALRMGLVKLRPRRFSRQSGSGSDASSQQTPTNLSSSAICAGWDADASPPQIHCPVADLHPLQAVSSPLPRLASLAAVQCHSDLGTLPFLARVHPPAHPVRKSSISAMAG